MTRHLVLNVSTTRKLFPSSVASILENEKKKGIWAECLENFLLKNAKRDSHYLFLSLSSWIPGPGPGLLIREFSPFSGRRHDDGRQLQFFSPFAFGFQCGANQRNAFQKNWQIQTNCVNDQSIFVITAERYGPKQSGCAPPPPSQFYWSHACHGWSNNGHRFQYRLAVMTAEQRDASLKLENWKMPNVWTCSRCKLARICLVFARGIHVPQRPFRQTTTIH